MIPLEILRVAVGLLLLFFAHFLGRSIVRVRAGRQQPRSVVGWIVRTLIAVFLILWRRGFDSISIAALALAAAALALGIWEESRPKRQEDLTKQIFGG
jgi:hypothetical protein